MGLYVTFLHQGAVSTRIADTSAFSAPTTYITR